MGRWSGILRVGGEDGVTWLGSLEEWSLRYEAEHAALDETTMQVAVGSIDILFLTSLSSREVSLQVLLAPC